MASHKGAHVTPTNEQSTVGGYKPVYTPDNRVQPQIMLTVAKPMAALRAIRATIQHMQLVKCRAVKKLL